VIEGDGGWGGGECAEKRFGKRSRSLFHETRESRWLTIRATRTPSLRTQRRRRRRRRRR